MAKEKKNYVREVTFDGRTIVDTDALLADPDVRRSIETLGKAFKLARNAQRNSPHRLPEPNPAQ